MHFHQLEAVQKEVDQLKGEVVQLQGVEAEQHKTERALRVQLAGFATALKGRIASPVWLPFFIRLLLSDLACLTTGFYPAVEDEAKKTHLASIGVAPREAAMSACQPTVREVLAQFGRETVALVAAAREVLQVLWPNDSAPAIISKLADQLAKSPNRILDLQESAARGGAQWAVSLLLSWYPDADIEVFNEGPRDGTDYSELRLLNGVHRTASSIAEFVDFDDFIPTYVDPKGKKAKVDEGDVVDGDEGGCSNQAAKTDK